MPFINPEDCSSICKSILEMSREVLDLLDRDLVEEALSVNCRRLEQVKVLSESLAGFRSKELTEFCHEYIRIHEEIVSKISDMQRVIRKSLENRHSTAKKMCVYQDVSRVGR